MSVKNVIYLDYNATSPVMPEVLEGMLPYFSTHFGNSISATHSHGWDADRAVENARKQVAELIGCDPHEIVFTSGATESNNWCLRGLVDRWRKAEPGCPIHIIASPLEHGSVSQVLAYLRDFHGVTVDFLPVDRTGYIDTAKIPALLRPETKLLSVSWVQNEIGTVQPVDEIIKIAKEKGVLVLTDATQALGKIEVDLKKTAADYLSFSAHKIGGPKGVGFLFLRKTAPKPVPLFHGGGHERGLRSETVNVPGVVGLGLACDWWRVHGADERASLREKQSFLWEELRREFPSVHLNGAPLGPGRSPMNLNVTFAGGTVPPTFPGLCVSKGSACSSGSASMSASLVALGLSDGDIERTVRFSLGKSTTHDEIKGAIDILKRQIRFP